MNEEYSRYYIREVRCQCDAALLAFTEMANVLKKQPQPPSASFLTFFYVHAFLAHLGNISKLFFPACRKRKNAKEYAKLAAKRAEFLRDTFNVGEQCPLSERKVRDSFEHFDERLDVYLDKATPPLYMDMNLTPRCGIRIGGKVPTDAFRHLDPGTLELSFQGDSVKLVERFEEIRRIRGIAETWLEQEEGQRWRRARPNSVTET